MYTGNPLNLSISSNTTGTFNNQLPDGTAKLFVRITDSMGGVTTYYIAQTVTVVISKPILVVTVNNLTNFNVNCSSAALKLFQSSSIMQTAKFSINVASALNTLSGSAGGNNVVALNERVCTRSVLISAICNMQVSDMTDALLVSSSLSTITSIPGEVTLSSSVSLTVLNNLFRKLEVFT
jgi:hypothetical protein